MQFQRNDKKRSALPASEGRPAKDLQPTKKHPQRHCPGLLLANPAHAGKREFQNRPCPRCRDHPRMAGKRRTHRETTLSSKDHPRTCGEKGITLIPLLSGLGSPPHMRGKVRREGRRHAGRRITPAYAGKSTGHRRCPARRWDHPRVCGEKVPPDGVLAPNPGSPPHVRGKEGRVRLFQRLGGITPAYAGKSAQKVLSFWPIRGSPPHMRGKVIVDLVLTERHRITPACAGKSGRNPAGAF